MDQHDRCMSFTTSELNIYLKRFNIPGRSRLKTKKEKCDHLIYNNVPLPYKSDSTNINRTLSVKTSSNINTGMKLDNLANNPLFVIANNLPLIDLLDLCQTSKRFSDFCQNNNYWKYRAVNTLGYNINDLPNTINRQWFMFGSLYIKHEGNISYVGNKIRYATDHNDNVFLIDDKYNLLHGWHNNWNIIARDIDKISVFNVSDVDHNPLLLMRNRNGKLYSLAITEHNYITTLIETNSEVEYITGRNFIVNGDVYHYVDDKTIQPVVLPKDVGKIRFMNVYRDKLGEVILYITKNNDLYVSVELVGFISKIANNVKYASIMANDPRSNLIRDNNIFWIDHQNNFYTRGLLGHNKYNLLETHHITNNITSFSVFGQKVLILTRDHILYENENESKHVKHYAPIAYKVLNVYTGDKYIYFITDR